MPAMSRNDLALAIAGSRPVRTVPSHERIEDAAGRQICYVQGRSLICKTDTLTGAAPTVAALLTPRGYNRSVLALIEGKGGNLAAARKVVDAAAKGHGSKGGNGAAPAASKTASKGGKPASKRQSKPASKTAPVVESAAPVVVE